MPVTSFVLLVEFSTLALSQHSPYSSEETRPIQSLSQKEIDDYLCGAGRGYANAPELNHYPKPLHVLELAEKLHFTKEQIKRRKRATIL